MRKAFSLVEIVVAIAIIAILATISLPSLKSLINRDNKKIFLKNLNTLCLNGVSSATLSGSVIKVIFDFEKNIVYLEPLDKKSNDVGFQYITSSIELKTNLFDVKNFFINNKDEMELHTAEIKKNSAWFYILPDGTCQPVIINTLFKESEETEEISFVSNPFTCQFKLYEKFEYPT